MDIKLDKKTLKALSNDARAEIIKLLGKRRYTQSEISEILKLSVPTIKEHLNALVKADLIQKNEEGRKWKYYSLTKKGKAVLNPEDTKILLLLVMTLLSVAGGVWMYIQSIPSKIMRIVPIFKDKVVTKTVETAPTAKDVLASAKAPGIIAQETVTTGAGMPQAVTTGAGELLETTTQAGVDEVTRSAQETVTTTVQETVKTQVGQETVIDVITKPEIFIKLCWVFAFIAIILLIWITIKIKERKKHKEMLGKNLTKK